MIINTIIVFLRDLLPVFILACYLSTFFERQKMSLSFLYSVISGGAALTVCLFAMAEVISEWFEGAGLEIAYATLLALFYMACVYMATFAVRRNKTYKLLMFVGVSTFIALKGAEFLIFFHVYGQQSNNLQNIVIGCIVGLGICISFSALFRFVLGEIKHSQHPWIFVLLWCAFLAGQFSQIISILAQVDIITLGVPLFDASSWIKDSSEYGHILNALFGYESSPTMWWAITYCMAFTIPLAMTYLFQSKKQLSVEAHHE